MISSHFSTPWTTGRHIESIRETAFKPSITPILGPQKSRSPDRLFGLRDERSSSSSRNPRYTLVIHRSKFLRASIAFIPGTFQPPLAIQQILLHQRIINILAQKSAAITKPLYFTRANGTKEFTRLVSQLYTRHIDMNHQARRYQ